MASTEVTYKLTDAGFSKEIRIEVAGILAGLEHGALKHGVDRWRGYIRCERNRGRYGWAINGNRASKLDVAKSIASALDAEA